MHDELVSARETIVLGAGCFWGVEDVLRARPGVVSTRVGYTGGGVPDPTYERVCSGTTGHAEAVEVVFDPSAIALDDLLRFFWSHHVATGSNRGQYRSIVGCDASQRAAVEAAKADVEASTGEPVTTEIVVGAPFYEAEDYHQQYYEKGRDAVREVRRQSGLPPAS